MVTRAWLLELVAQETDLAPDAGGEAMLAGRGVRSSDSALDRFIFRTKDL